MDLGDTVILYAGEGPGGQLAVGEIYNIDDFPCVEENECEAVEIFAVEIADKIVRSYKCHDALLAALKEEHGWDDPLHITAQPNCWKCAAITKAEPKPKEKTDAIS
jgi:hypothetical protein